MQENTQITPPPTLGELAEAMLAARALAEAAGVPVPKWLAKEAISTVRQAMRAARGLPPRAPSAAPAEV